MVQAIAAGDLASVAEGRAAVSGSVQLDIYEPRGGPDWDAALFHLRNIAAHTRTY